jgi:glycosyltransferase involved in cell wall biosynthesis
VDKSISCIVPVFNMERYVGDALRSVLSQIQPCSEIIVVDDGSEDSTAQEIARFGDAVAYLHQPHAGVSAARNFGVRRAQGEFICFLDADDRYHPAKLRDQIDAFMRNPALEFCGAHSAHFWTEEFSEEERRADHRYAHPFWERLAPGHISSWMLRRTTFHQVGFFDEDLHFSEDTDWLLRCRDAGIVGETLPQCVSFRRLHRGNATAANRQEQVEGLARAIMRSRARKSGLQTE